MTEERPSPSECLTPEDAEALLLGQLAPKAAAALQVHLDGCERCREDLAQRQADNELLTDLRTAHQSRLADEPSAAGRANNPMTSGTVEIEGFEIIEEIHRGGQGVVYKARQHSPNRLVALKVLREDMVSSLRDRARFEREIELAASLRHPNIVTVYETGMSSGSRYFAMEYVDGQPLDSYALKGGLSLREKVELLLKVGRSVQAAHQRGVVHRDLKPGNVLVDDTGEPHVLDFGIAMSAGIPSLRDQRITIAGEFLGTVAYASPEQTGSDPHGVDVRSDVYSLGVLGFEILTGQLPYELPEDLAEAIQSIRESSPTPPSQISPEIDDDLETILTTALAKQVERRYTSAEALCRDLEHYLADKPIEAKRDSVWYVLRKNARRHRLAVTLITGGFILVTAFAVTMALLYQQSERSARRSQRTRRFLQNTLASVNAWVLGPDATLFDVLANAERSMHAELVDLPDVEAELRYTIGLTFVSVRRDELARKQLQAAYDFYSGNPDEHEEQLAVCMANLGRLENNVAHLRRAVLLHESLHENDSPEVLLTRLDLAYALTNGGASGFKQADTILNDVEERLRARYGQEHRYISRLLQMRGWLRWQQGHDEEAAVLFAQSLQVYQNQAIPDAYAPELFQHYTDLLIALDRPKEAEALLTQAMHALPPVFGRAWLPKLQWRRGRLQFDTGQTKAAERSYRQTLALQCMRSIDHQPARQAELQVLASRLHGAEQDGEKQLYEEALRLLWQGHVADKTTLVHCACDLAELCFSQGETHAACELLALMESLADRAPTVDRTAIFRVQELREQCTRGAAAEDPARETHRENTP